jgi:hypothetical protein
MGSVVSQIILPFVTFGISIIAAVIKKKVRIKGKGSRDFRILQLSQFLLNATHDGQAWQLAWTERYGNDTHDDGGTIAIQNNQYVWRGMHKHHPHQEWMPQKSDFEEFSHIINRMVEQALEAQNKNPQVIEVNGKDTEIVGNQSDVQGTAG